MKYYGVVVLFHPDKDILDNINTYIDEIEKLYVIDNTPDADIQDKFKDYKKIEYIPLKENKGIAYALNLGAKKAIEEKADWLLTMDQDSSFQKDSLSEMKEFLVEFKNNKFMEKLMRTKFSKLAIITPFHITERTKLDKPRGIDWPLEVMTSGNLVNLEAYKKVGGFKDWLFIDCVDFDFCLNLRNHDYEIIQLNYCKLNHGLGNTVQKKIFNKTIYADNHSAFRRYFIARNRHYLYDLYNKDFPIYCNLEIKRTRKELLKIWLFEKHKWKKTKATIKGYLDYKKGVKGGKNG